MNKAVIARRAVLAAALFSLVLAGPASAATSTVSALDPASFSPSSKSINLGDRINWTNPSAGTRDHTSTANSTNPMAWNFNLDENDASPPTFGVNFTHAGAFGYHCNIHSTMNGSVLVKLKSTRIDSNSWTVRMANATAPAGFTHELQRRKKGTSTWFTVTTTANATARFDAPSAGTWQLRGRYKKTGGAISGFSPTLEVVTQ